MKKKTIQQALPVYEIRCGDLIRRSELIDALCQLIDPDDIYPYIQGVMSAYNRITNAPSVDAVVVVRCRDCAYRDAPNCCPLQITGFKITAEWFCPMGVRGDIYYE